MHFDINALAAPAILAGQTETVAASGFAFKTPQAVAAQKGGK